MKMTHAHGAPPACALLKAQPEDFIVDEVLSFEPSGQGEHALVLIEKRDETTDRLIQALARFTETRPRDIGYAGLKDRHGITRQWFSVPLAGRQDPAWTAFNNDHHHIVSATRNDRKLRHGAIKHNRFHLRLRALEGDGAQLEPRLKILGEAGVPNYFGPQRFGRDGENVARALALFQDPDQRVTPHLRGLYLSAARSQLFNQILELRVAAGVWDKALDGDVFMFQGSKSFFGPDPGDASLTQRVADLEIHPSGPLVGREDSTTTGDARAFEERILSQQKPLVDGLRATGLETQRRPLRLIPQQLEWTFSGDDQLELRFDLPTGSYATTVIRELIEIKGPHTSEF